MAHFAQLNDSNTVTAVIVVHNDVINNLSFPDSEPSGVAFCKQLYGNDTVWVQTSYSSSFRKNYASVGGQYNPDLDAFVAPNPFASWVLNNDTCQWQAPVPRPDDGQRYYWNEVLQSWQPAC